MAIATGGSTFYRNRINTYLKQGMTQKEAESKAWLDFQELAEETQQSSRPDRISQQQRSTAAKTNSNKNQQQPKPTATKNMTNINPFLSYSCLTHKRLLTEIEIVKINFLFKYNYNV